MFSFRQIVLAPIPSKPRKEKFEDVFPGGRLALQPTSFSRSKQSSPSAIVCAETTVTENDNRNCKKTLITVDTLHSVVSQFLRLDRDNSFSENFKETLNCDNYFVYYNRRITKLLLFDLVKQQRLLSTSYYTASSSFGQNNCIDRNVTKNVFKVLDAKLSHNRMLRIDDAYDVQKYENDLLVNNLVTDSLRDEEPGWNYYEEEERIRKIVISEEILKDLLLETTLLYKNIILLKM